MSVVTMKKLLEAGVHFGHRTRRWDPKMQPYIYGERKGIYIVDLQKTLKWIDQVYDFVKSKSQENATFLFVGTKRQAQEIIEEEANRCGAFYVNNRWLGGLLTNFETIRKRTSALKRYEEMEESGEIDKMPKKEQSMLRRDFDKLRKNLNGVKNMERLPDVVYVVDTKKEEIAVAEANKLEIPVIGIADTNSDPDVLDFLIPGNDDAIRAIKLITSIISDAILEGREGLDTGASEKPKEASAEKPAKEKEEKTEETEEKKAKETQEKKEVAAAEESTDDLPDEEDNLDEDEDEL
ncbi:MAG: 30S ribosomal protein S2 [Kosmotoga sp.]|nr:MAG: 30S ribosomal protein S2 [Kosmotoga sp.]